MRDYLWVDCTTIACKIANIIDNHYIDRVPAKNIDQLEVDFDGLSTALSENDTYLMKVFWNRYHPMLKRYN